MRSFVRRLLTHCWFHTRKTLTSFKVCCNLFDTPSIKNTRRIISIAPLHRPISRFPLVTWPGSLRRGMAGCVNTWRMRSVWLVHQGRGFFCFFTAKSSQASPTVHFPPKCSVSLNSVSDRNPMPVSEHTVISPSKVTISLKFQREMGPVFDNVRHSAPCIEHFRKSPMKFA